MPPDDRPAIQGTKTGRLFELTIVGAGLWVGFRLDVVAGGQVGVDLLLAAAGWWFAVQLAGDRPIRAVLSQAFGAVWLAVLAAIALAIAWVLITTSVVADLVVRGAGLALLGGYANWHQIAWGPSEVVGSRLSTPLVHVWPVAVAVQMALVWSGLVAISRWWRRRGAERADPVVAAGLVVASLALVAGAIAVANGLSSQALTLSTGTRGVAFALGAVLGAWGATGASARFESVARSLIGAPLAVLGVLAVVGDPGSTWWRGGGSAVSSVVAAIVVAAAVADRHRASAPRELPAMAWFSLVAFVVVHGAVLAVMAVDSDGLAGAAAAFGSLVAAVVVAGALGTLVALRAPTLDGAERRRVVAPMVALALVVGLLSVTGAFAWAAPAEVGGGEQGLPDPGERAGWADAAGRGT